MKLNNINNKEPWLDKLKERVNNYSEPVPASGWEQLEKQLGPSQVAPVFFLKRHKWGIAAAAALLAAVSTIGLYFAHTPHLHELNQVAEEIIEQRPDVLLPIAAPEKSIQIAQAAPIRTESISKTANKQRGVNQTITQHSSAIETIHQEEVLSATNDTFTTNAESSITASSDKLENNADRKSVV